MLDQRPGLHPRRVATLVQAAVERCRLDLSDTVVLTEAATGAYVVTPVLAALAGARRVYAMTRPTRYGSVAEVTHQTLELARLVGAADRIEVITSLSPDLVSQADIVTNSGHVRPIDRELVSWMKPSAVIPLMYEAWEFRPGDVDLDACLRRGIRVAGTNERHPHVDVFSFLGMMAVKLLLDTGVAVYASRVLLLCNNEFRPFIERGLAAAGACVDTFDRWPTDDQAGSYDAVVVAMHPQPEPVLTAADARMLAQRWPGIVVAQYWGDIDRPALAAAGVPTWPLDEPAPGHMSILPSALGPEPIVRLQAGGLKVGEVLLRQARQCPEIDREFVNALSIRTSPPEGHPHRNGSHNLERVGSPQ